jgi:hypothetical protein
MSQQNGTDSVRKNTVSVQQSNKIYTHNILSINVRVRKTLITHANYRLPFQHLWRIEKQNNRTLTNKFYDFPPIRISFSFDEDRKISGFVEPCMWCRRVGLLCPRCDAHNRILPTTDMLYKSTDILKTTFYPLSITDWQPTVVHKYGKHLLWFSF